MRALLVTLALSASACGFGPNDSFTGQRQATGIAPWADLGGANVCAQPALFGPADSEPVGFCVPDSAPQPRACAVDSECAARERCVCGRCSVQYCDSAAGCGKDLTCDFKNKRCARKCTKTARCPFGQTCRGGYCTAKCETDAQCAQGELCSQTIKRCVVSSCTENAQCLVGMEHCSIQRVPGDLREPTLLPPRANGPQAVMFFELRRADRTVIHRAESLDGVGWTINPAEPVLEPGLERLGGETRVGAPSVVTLPSGGFVMFFDAGPTGDHIGRATSPDGVRFTRDEAPALSATSPWEAGKVHAPGATITSRGLYLFYEGGDGIGVGVARSTDDGKSFTRAGDGLVLASDREAGGAHRVSDAVVWRAVTELRSPFALAQRDAVGDEVLGVWFSAFGVESSSFDELGNRKPPVANHSIGYAAWNVSTATGDEPRMEAYPFNPVFDRVLSFLQHLQELSPAIVRLENGSYALVYGAIGAMGSYDNLGVAVNPPP
jgi:hypothetical protein